MIKREGRIEERQAAQYIWELIQAMQYMHSKHAVIHRDIKPENILIDELGSIRLADFGWSNYFEFKQPRFSYCGTPEYLAPEMIKKEGHTTDIDYWNLGVLIYELLCGSPPFEGKT